MVHYDFQSFINKMKWRLWFREHPSDLAGPPVKSDKRTPYCNRVVQPDFQPWSRAFRQAFLNEVDRCSKSFQPKSYGLLRLGISLLETLPYAIFRNDKDTGITLVHMNDVCTFWKLTVPEPLYQPVFLAHQGLPALMGELKRLASKIAAHEHNPRWFGAIISPCTQLLLALMGAKVKTHKPQGQQVPRSIHQSLGSSLKGVSEWTRQKLDPLLRDLPHIQKDSMAMKQFIQATPALSSEAELCTIDLKDFYLSGTASELARDLMTHLPWDQHSKDLMHQAVYMVLTHQYVHVPAQPYVYKCAKGSGIGLSHSAGITNLVFSYIVESRFLAHLASRSIKCYARYHDDIFVAGINRQAIADFVAEFERSLKYFKYKVTAASSHSVDILDLTVTLHGSTGRLVAHPSLNKTPLPLCPSSSHASRTHEAWPKAVVSRIAALSEGAPQARAKLIGLYRSVACHPAIIQLLQRAPFEARSLAPPDRRVQDRVARILKFHPVILRALRRALFKYPVPEALQLSICVGWANDLPSLSTFCERHNLKFGMGLGSPGMGPNLSVCSSVSTQHNKFLSLAQVARDRTLSSC